MVSTQIIENDVQGVLVDSKSSHGRSNVEISPNANIRIVDKGDTTTTLLDGYDSHESYRANVPFETPEGYANVRLTRTRENQLEEDKKGFSLVSYIITTFTNTDTGRKQESRVFDFAEKGNIQYERKLEGILEKMPEEVVQRKLQGVQDPDSVVLGLRSYNGKTVTPLVVHGLSGNIEESYGHKCKLDERITQVTDSRGYIGVNFDQNLTDLQTGKTYTAGTSLDSLNPSRVTKWKASAKQIQ